MDIRDQVIVLIPAYNEAGRIASVLEGVCQQLDAIVVDDGSQDQTAQVAARAGAKVLHLSPNQGKGAALRVGFLNAIELGYQAILTMDADGQHDPQDIPLFLETYQLKHPDLIIGARDFNLIPPIRRLANTLGRLAFSWALGQDIPDNQSGYRLVSRRLFQESLKSHEQGFEFEVEMIRTAVQLGYRLEWVPIRTIYAGETSHIQPIVHTKNFLRLVWSTRRSRR